MHRLMKPTEIVNVLIQTYALAIKRSSKRLCTV